MRSLIILVVFLAACNGSTTDNVPYTDPQVTAKIDALTQALADATHTQAQQAVSLGKLTLIGKVHGVSTESIRMQGEFRTEAVSNGISFGPCADMGVLVGFTNANGDPANALTATGEVFRQCTGFQYAINLFDGSIATAERVYFEGPNCTGPMADWEASGAGFNTLTLQGGVVFASPMDGSILMIAGGQSPQQISIQSAWVRENGACEADTETLPMYIIEPNSLAISGIPSIGVGKFQLSAP